MSMFLFILTSYPSILVLCLYLYTENSEGKILLIYIAKVKLMITFFFSTNFNKFLNKFSFHVFYGLLVIEIPKVKFTATYFDQISEFLCEKVYKSLKLKVM